MSLITVTPVQVIPPAPGYKTYTIAIATLLSATVFPILHSYIPAVPALDISTTTSILMTFASLGLLFHRYGLNLIAQYILVNLVPVLMPTLESSLIYIVRNELNALKPQATAAGIDLDALETVLNDLGVKVDAATKLEIAAKLSYPKSVK